MTSSNTAYLSFDRVYEAGRLTQTTMDNLQKSSHTRTPHRADVTRLVEDIKKEKVNLVTNVYRAHRTAVQSIREIEEGLHVLFVLYCVHLLECAGRAVTSLNLLRQCQDFAQGLPESVSNVLFGLFPSVDVELAEQAATPSGARSDAAAVGATSYAVSESASSPAAAPSSFVPTAPSRTSSTQDCVDGVTRGGAYQTDVSLPVAQDEPDNISFSTRSVAPLEPAANNVVVAKPSEGLVGATASPDALDFRISEQREDGHQRRGGDPKADDARHVKECLWAVRHENKILETYKQCVQCKKNPRDITFLPCGHFITCRQCAGPIFTCMLCNRAILATIDTYLS